MEKKDYIALVDRAKQLSFEYYVLSKPTVTDAQFDTLVSEIEQAETDHPDWTLADSPTQMVGSDVQNNGRRLIRHRTRMLSCQKAQTLEAVEKWITATEKKLKRTDDIQYALGWKLDGISCSLVYQDGRLTEASSRGDKGIMGQDLLDHVMLMKSVPQMIDMRGRVEVRGEIICPKDQLDMLGYKDCRTAASALTNQIIPSMDCARLIFVAWQMDSADGIGTESVSMELAENHGFLTCGLVTCWHNEVAERLNEFAAKRDALPYPTDGVVIKINCKPLAASLGATEHHPKGSIAYKFSVQKTITRVIRIEVSIGEKGGRTPVAYLEPVMIMGREVKHASLYSEKVWQELGVTEGSMVEVGLTNDVTPKIYRVISTPTDTPSCEHCEHEPVYSDPIAEIIAEAVQEDPVVLQSSATGSVLRQAQEPLKQAQEPYLVGELVEPQEPLREDFVDNDEKMRKVIAIVGAVAITLLMIHFFGLLGPAVFGLLAGGILKG